MPRKNRHQKENVFLKIVEALEGLPSAALDQVKDFILSLKETKARQRPSVIGGALAQRQVAAIKRWAGKDLGPGFSGKEHDAILYDRDR